MQAKEKPTLGNDPLAWVFEEDKEEDGAAHKIAAPQPAHAQDEPRATAPNIPAAPATVAETPDSSVEVDTAGPGLRLANIIDIASVGPLWEQACGLAEQSTLEIDAAAVERIGTAGLQVLCALHQDVTARGGDIVWLNPSETLCQAAARLGLQQALCLPA